MILDFGFLISDLKNPHQMRNQQLSSAQLEIRNPKSEIPIRGFTLVEILVVIAIIAVLLGIGLLVGPEVIGSGNKQVTSALLNNCRAILAEYQSLVKMPVNNYGATPIDWGTDKSPNVPGFTGPDVDLSISSAGEFATKSIEQFVYATYKIESIKTKLYSSNAVQFGTTSLLGDSDSVPNGMLDLVDGWGNKLVYVASNPNPGSDGYKWDDAYPAHSTPYFVSAGADGKLGDLRSSTQATKDQAADNLYSYDAN